MQTSGASADVHNSTWIIEGFLRNFRGVFEVLLRDFWIVEGLLDLSAKALFFKFTVRKNGA